MGKKANVNLKIDAEDADAVRSFLKLTQAERNLEIQTKKTSNAMKGKEKASKKVNNQMSTMAKNAVKAGVAMVGIGSAKAVIAGVTQEIEKLDQALIESAKRANQQSRGVREFMALQAPGPEGRKHARETLLAGAMRGLTPDPAGMLAQPIQSLADANGDGRLIGEEKKQFWEDYSTALKLNEATVTPEDALAIVAAGRSRGRSGKEAANILINAAGTSKEGPATFGASVSSMAGFSNLEEGMAVLSALTKEEFNVGKLPAAMDRLGLVLGASGEVGQFEAFSKKFNLGGLTEIEKLSALRRHAIETGDQSLSEQARVKAFTDDLSAEKGLSAELAKNLGMAVRQSPSAESTRQILASSVKGALDEFLKKDMADSITRGGILAARQEGLTAYSDIAGPHAEEAQRRLARRQVLGAEALAEGDVANVNAAGELKLPSEWTWAKWLGAAARPGRVGWAAGREVRGDVPYSHDDVMRRQDEWAAELKEGIDQTVDGKAAGRVIQDIGQAGGGRYIDQSYTGPAIDSPVDFAPIGRATPGMGRNFADIGRATPEMRAGGYDNLISSLDRNSAAMEQSNQLASGANRANAGRVGGNPSNYEEAR